MEYDGTADLSLLTRRRKERAQAKREDSTTQRRSRSGGMMAELSTILTDGDEKDDKGEDSPSFEVENAEDQKKGSNPKPEAKSLGTSIRSEEQANEPAVMTEELVQDAVERAAEEGRLEWMMEYDGTADLSLLTRRRKERAQAKREDSTTQRRSRSGGMMAELSTILTDGDEKDDKGEDSPSFEVENAEDQKKGSNPKPEGEAKKLPEQRGKEGGGTLSMNEMGKQARRVRLNRVVMDRIDEGSPGLMERIKVFDGSRPPAPFLQSSTSQSRSPPPSQPPSSPSTSHSSTTSNSSSSSSSSSTSSFSPAPLPSSLASNSVIPSEGDAIPVQDPSKRSYEERLLKMKEMENVTNYREYQKKMSAYKPTVSTWGVFERPRDISKAYGGGRTVKRGEYEKWLEEQNKKLQKTLKGEGTAIPLKDEIDPMLEKVALQNISMAFTLLEDARLYEARRMFEVVRKQFPFRSKIAGRATYGLGLTLDALGQNSKAQDIYRSLRFHPNKDIKKSASTMLSGFEAMEFFGLDAEDNTDYSSFDRYFQNLGSVSRFDLSSSTIVERSEEDIEAERRDIILSIMILIGFFILPTLLIGWFRYRLHLYPILPFL